MKANCIRVTKEEVANLAKQLGISEAKTHANILLWSGDKQIDRLPTADELEAFINAKENSGEFSGESDNIYEDIGGEEGEKKTLGLSKAESKPAQRKQLFFSGDANGSDKAWAQEAKVLGLNVKPYTVQDWDALSDEWKAKLDKEYQEIVHILGRKALPIDDYRGKLVRRDMMQADKADAVFAIGTIGNNGYVDGGTGYATTRGIQRGIPVYLYDRKDKRWKVWDKTKKAFIETAEPTITPNAALIGTRGDIVGKDASGRDIRDITEEDKYAIRSILGKSFPRQGGIPTSSISTTGYRKGDPQKHPDTAFIFTENAEAYTFTQGLMSDAYAFPNPNNPKINVSDVNGTNQAGIRTDTQGNLTPNAFGIIVKKYQQDANGRFVAKEGQFQDTNEDFKMFKTLNEHMFNRLKQSGLKNIVFPSQMALGKSALPRRFAEWLQQELLNRFGVSSTIEENTTPGYEGYGLKINSVVDKSSVSDKSEDEIEQFVTAAPFFRQKLTSENKEDLEKQTEIVKEKAQKLAKEVGLEIEVVATIGGTYNGSSEISYKYVIKSGEQDKIDLFAALLGDLGFEYQDAVIAANYVSKEDWETLPNSDKAIELSYSVPHGTKIEDIEKTLKDNGIEGSSFSFEDGILFITAFSEEEAETIVSKLNNSNYEKKSITPQNSRYLDNERRRALYKTRLSQSRGENRKLDNACSKALAICEAAAPYYTKERGVDPDEEVDAEEAQRIKAARDAANNWKPQHSQLSQGTAASKNEEITLTEESTPVSRNTASPMVTVEKSDVAALNAAYANPNVKKFRVNEIAKRFSEKLAEKFEERISELDTKIAAAEKEGNTTEANRLFVQRQKLTKADVLAEMGGVRSIFNDIYAQYDPESITFEAEANLYDELFERPEEWTDEDFKNYINNTVAYKKAEYQKVRDNFWALAEEATLEIKKQERIIIDISSSSMSKDSVKNDSLNDDDTSSENPTNNTQDVEEKGAESWMNNFRSISGMSSLSVRTRAALQKLLELNKDGSVAYTDLWEERTIDPEWAHAVLLYGLADMVESSDMTRLLLELGKKYSFVRQLYRQNEDGTFDGMLVEDPQLMAAFYHDFRKDLTSYWASRGNRNFNTGEFEEDRTIALNSRENISFMLAAWQHNTETGLKVGGNDTIFNENGTINGDVNEKMAKALAPLAIKFEEISKRTLTPDERNAAVINALDDNNKEGWNSLIRALRSIGIDQDEEDIRWALVDSKFQEGKPIYEGISSVITAIQTVYSQIKGNPTEFLKANSKGEYPVIDILTKFRQAYTTIAEEIKYLSQGETESSFHHMDKTRYSYNTPNYLGKMMKKLQGVQGEEKFNEFIESEYGRFNWFRKSVDGQQVWLNSWLDELVKRPELRKYFKHKVVLDFNKKGFFEAGSLEYALGLLREFNAPLAAKIEGKDQEMAWYYVPMLSDTDSSEFIQFTKDTKEGYQDRLLAKMRLTVYQELDRIALVKKRAEKIANKEAEPIANFDDRGKEFCFFPALNTWKDAGNNSFMSIMESYAAQIDAAEDNGNTAVKEALETERAAFIDSVLREIIENDVDETYRRYSELGVFDKTEDGKFKYLKGSKNQDLHMQNNKAFIKEVLDIARQTPDKYANFIKHAEQYLENPFSLTYSERSKLFGYASKFNTRGGEVKEQDDHREIISKYVYNSRFATSQIVQIFATDYAYYKNAVDFQKRFKEVHAPSLRLFTLAEYNGKRIGRDTERSIYLADEKIVSNTYDELKQAIDWRVRQGQLSRASGDYILAQYRKINVSDAQAYRCLSSYRAIMGMTGQWNDALENAYNKFTKSGKWGIEEFTTIFQTKKPYLYTQVGIDSQVDGQQIKVGAQHKNSEFLLLAMIPSIVNGTPMQSASKLAALNKIMEEGYNEGRGIDVVNFTSAVKVGNQGIVEFTYDDTLVNIPYEDKVYANVAALKKHLDSQLADNKITGAKYNEALKDYLLSNKSVDYIEEYLKKKLFVNGKDNPAFIHTFSYEDYGIQTQTPEHIIDHEQLFGTQIRRLIGADITPGTILTVGGVQMTAEQWWQTYNGLLVDNIVDSYTQVSEKFSSPEKLHALLVETIKGSDRYPKDLLNAIRLVDETGPNGKPTGRKRFNIPLFDHATADVVESLINSVIKDTVTKQKIRGGSCIQVSSFGLSDKLSVVYEGEGKNKRVKYMECYMPAYAKDFYEGLLIPVDSDGNEITNGSQPAGYIFNPDLLDDDLRRAIGYRVPTEDKYSMAPLYIKGFLPQQNGSAIMLPAEITTLSGSDFDIDKMYIMLPEFDVIRYDKESARRDYEQFNRKYGRTQSWITDVFNAIMDENFNEEENESSDASKAFSEWWKENKEKYKLERPRYRRVNGSFKKTEDGFTFDDGLSKKTNPTRADRERARKKRNNAIIDMMYSVLTNADTLQRFVKPGGYDEVKKQAFIERILSNVSYSELKSKLGIANDAKISDVLNKKTVDELDNIASAFCKTLDPLSVTTQMHFHKQNSAGSKAIGIYAVNNAGQALLQHSKLSLAKSNDPSVSKIVLFGKEYTDLNKVVNENGQYITNNEAQYLAAAVDNGKDPTLEDNGQNDFTYNMSNLLIRLGVGHKEVAAIMNQPIIKEMASAVTKGAADGKSRDEIVLEVLQKYADKAGVSYTDTNVSEDIGVSLEDMYRDRCSGAEKQGTEFYARQLKVGLWFESNGESAQFLNNSTQNLRGDAQNAAAGPRVIDTVVRQIRIENSIKEEYGLYDSSKNYSIEEMKNHPLGFIIAFQQFGIKGTADILEEYFPHYSSDFMGTLKNLIQRTKNRSIPVDLAQKLFDAAVTYRLSGLPLLNSLKKDKEWVTASKEEVVKYFYYKFPETFKHAKETNPVVYEANGVEVHFNDIPLIQVLKTVPSGRNNPIVSVVMDNAGRLTKEGKQRLTQSWESLVYSGDERAITLAINLFAYSLIRYDGKFSPSGFAHLAPVAVEESCAGYSDRMEAMRLQGLNIGGDSDFRTLFLRNNTDNRTLFPKITAKEADALKDSIDAGFISMDVAAQCPSIAKISGEKSASVTYFNGFCIQDGKEMKYYILEPISKKEADIIEVMPLGVKGKMVEYFIDSDFATSKSRIMEDKRHSEENSELAQSDDTGFSAPMSPEDSYDIDVTTDDEGNEICK